MFLLKSGISTEIKELRIKKKIERSKMRKTLIEKRKTETEEQRTTRITRRKSRRERRKVLKSMRDQETSLERKERLELEKVYKEEVKRKKILIMK